MTSAYEYIGAFLPLEFQFTFLNSKNQPESKELYNFTYLFLNNNLFKGVKIKIQYYISAQFLIIHMITLIHRIHSVTYPGHLSQHYSSISSSANQQINVRTNQSFKTRTVCAYTSVFRKKNLPTFDVSSAISPASTSALVGENNDLVCVLCPLFH